jgi:hypothetical protein
MQLEYKAESSNNWVLANPDHLGHELIDLMEKTIVVAEKRGWVMVSFESSSGNRCQWRRVLKPEPKPEPRLVTKYLLQYGGYGYFTDSYGTYVNRESAVKEGERLLRAGQAKRVKISEVQELES